MFKILKPIYIGSFGKSLQEDGESLDRITQVLTSITTRMARFVTLVSRVQELKSVLPITTYDILKQHRIMKKTDYVTGARKNVGTQVVQQFGIQCYNCKEYGHVARECHKLKQAKDAAYQKEKMLLCKQEEAGFQLNAEQAGWRDDTGEYWRSGIRSTLYVHGTDSRSYSRCC
ncbi:gag-pol polyprotein [Tanacetum coccineum]